MIKLIFILALSFSSMTCIVPFSSNQSDYNSSRYKINNRYINAFAICSTHCNQVCADYYTLTYCYANLYYRDRYTLFCLCTDSRNGVLINYIIVRKFGFEYKIEKHDSILSK